MVHEDEDGFVSFDEGLDALLSDDEITILKDEEVAVVPEKTAKNRKLKNNEEN